MQKKRCKNAMFVYFGAMPVPVSDEVIGYIKTVKGGKANRKLTRYMLLAYKAYAVGIPTQHIAKELGKDNATVWRWLKAIETRMPQGYEIIDPKTKPDPQEQLMEMRQDALNAYRWQVAVRADIKAARDILEQTAVFKDRSEDMALAELRNTSDEEIIRNFVRNVFRTKNTELFEILADAIQYYHAEYLREQAKQDELRAKLGVGGQDTVREAPVVETDGTPVQRPEEGV